MGKNLIISETVSLKVENPNQCADEKFDMFIASLLLTLS